MCFTYNHLPTALTHLSVYFGYFQTNLLDHLPSSITYLSLSSTYILSIDHLPTSLTHLIFRNQNCFSEDSLIYVPQNCKVSVSDKRERENEEREREKRAREYEISVREDSEDMARERETIFNNDGGENEEDYSYPAPSYLFKG